MIQALPGAARTTCGRVQFTDGASGRRLGDATCRWAGPADQRTVGAGAGSAVALIGPGTSSSGCHGRGGDPWVHLGPGCRGRICAPVLATNTRTLKRPPAARRAPFPLYRMGRPGQRGQYLAEVGLAHNRYAHGIQPPRRSRRESGDRLVPTLLAPGPSRPDPRPAPAERYLPLRSCA